MPEQDFKSLTVDEVLLAVQNGDISAEEALAIENQGKGRKTLIEALGALTDYSSINEKDSETVDQQSITIKFIENVKVGTSLFKAGEELEVTEKQLDEFVKAKVIEIGD